MPLSYTYSTLRQDLQVWIEDDNAEFIDQLDTIIGLGELRVVRDMDLEIFDVVRSGKFTAGAFRVDKPDGYLDMRSFHFIDYDGGIEYIEPRSYDVVRDFNSSPFDYGRPRYWCEVNEEQWGVAPLPEAAFQWEARIIKRPQGLSCHNATSWIGTNLPQALMYACLIEAEAYVKDDERMQSWRSVYVNDVIPAARMELRHGLRGRYSPQADVEGRQ